MKYYVVKFSGKLGFIKSFQSVRDSLSISQKFLTPSIIKGMEMKLETDSIVRHRLSFSNISTMQEQTRSKLPTIQKKKAFYNTSIINRGYLVNPILHLAFSKKEDAIKASTQHLCLCRLEDIIYPSGGVLEMTENEFNELKGFELLFNNNENSILVGYNRFNNASRMTGELIHQD